MSFLTALGSLLGGPISIAGDWVMSKREEAREESRHQNRIKEARADAEIAELRAGGEHARRWADRARGAVKWADDMFTAWSGYVLWGAFIPALQPGIQKGFEVLEGYPPWVQALLSVVFASAFGLERLKGWFKR